MINLRCCLSFFFSFILIFRNVWLGLSFLECCSFSILRWASAKNQLLCIHLCSCGFSCVFLNVFFYVKVFHGAKNGLNILSINSLSQNISFLYVLLLLSLLYFISFFSFSLSISVSCKKFMFSAFFPFFFSHSHTVRKKSASLQSREFRFVCVYVYNGVSLWLRRKKKTTKEICSV